MSQRHLDPDDTIAAVASPPGPGVRGIVRLSGTQAWPIVLGAFETAGGQPLPAHPELRTGRLIVDGLSRPLNASVALWPGPRTYTGQNLAEIHTLGAPPLLNLVLTHLLARGTRLAEPGEFTLRAFLSGRLDLTRAEAVLNVIEARTPAQLDAALQQLAGGLATPITGIRNRLLDVLAHLEAGLDFVDEPDVDPLERQALAAELAASAVELDTISRRLQSRDRPEGRPRVVLIGPPNAGKSCLFNALLGQARAIVSPQAGTTRDYLSAVCHCDGLEVELIDTAGLDVASGPIEHRAQRLRTDQAGSADLLLECRSADTSVSLAPAIDQANLRVWTKSDLAPCPGAFPNAIATSAATGAGIEPLRAAIAAALRGLQSEGDLPSATSARCRESLLKAREALLATSETILLEGGDELISLDLRQAIDELGKVVGAVFTDDILDRIFSRFCIGK